MDKKIIKEQAYINNFEFSGEIDFETLREFIYEAEFEGFDGIDFVPYGSDGGEDIYYFKYREKTDAEYVVRLAEEEKEKQKELKKKEARRKQYEELKREFESEESVKAEIEKVIDKYMFELKTVDAYEQIKSEIAKALMIPIESVKLTKSSWTDSIEFVVNNKKYSVTI